MNAFDIERLDQVSVNANIAKESDNAVVANMARDILFLLQKIENLKAERNPLYDYLEAIDRGDA